MDISCAPDEFLNSKLECDPCPLGSFSMGGTVTDCTCQAGWYSEESGCTECPMGFYQPNPGSTSCIGCPVGQYMDMVASTEPCKLCPEGTHTAFKQTATCYPCVDNTIQPDEGKDDCFPCDAGQTAVDGIVCVAGNLSKLSLWNRKNKQNLGAHVREIIQKNSQRCYTAYPFGCAFFFN